MKVFKKVISLILTAAIMMSMICVGTVSAGALEDEKPTEIKIGNIIKGNAKTDIKTSMPTYIFYFFDDEKNTSFGNYNITIKSNNAKTYIDAGIISKQYKTIYSESENAYYLTDEYNIDFNKRYSFLTPQGNSEIKITNTDGKYTESSFTGVVEAYDGDWFYTTTTTPYYNQMPRIDCVTEDKATLTDINIKFDRKDILDEPMYDNYAFYISVTFSNAYKGVGEVKSSGDFEIIVDRADSTNKNSTSTQKSISSLSFSKVSDYTYTGEARKPAVTIKDGSYTLKKGTDYTLSYKNNKDIGTASITIKGKGKYTGSKTIQFKIVPKKTTLKVTKKSDTKAKFTWAAVDGAEKYQIYYSTDGKKYKKLATVSGGKTSATISKLDFDKYDYKFKIRSYGTDNSKKYYSSFSKTVTVK